MTIREYSLLRLDEFNRPIFFYEKEAIAAKFLYLLNAKKFSNIEDPEFGIDIRKYKHEYLNEATFNELKSTIIKQQERYLPDLPIDNLYFHISDETIEGRLRKVLKIDFIMIEKSYSFSFFFTIDKNKFISYF
jgi:hypothetical protein